MAPRYLVLVSGDAWGCNPEQSARMLSRLHNGTPGECESGPRSRPASRAELVIGHGTRRTLDAEKPNSAI